MKKGILDAGSVDLEEYIRLYNPFAVRNEKDEMMIFKSYREVYLDMIERFYKASPRGYLDVVLFISDLYKMNLPNAEDTFRGMKKLGVTEIMQICWREMHGCDDEALRRLLKGFHTISETRFDESRFRDALDLIKNKLGIK